MEDAEVNAVQEVARWKILPFVTLEWVHLALSLINHICDVVEALPAGITLWELLEGLRMGGSAAMVPSASQASVVSLTMVLPHSRSPSTGLGVSHPSPHQAVVDITDCPARLLLCWVILTEVPFVVILAMALSSTHPAFSAPLPIAGPAAMARSSEKRLVYKPLPHCPSRWCTCAWCNRWKSKCRPPVGVHPPYSCMICLNLRQPCVLGPTKKRCICKACAEAPPSKLMAATASSGACALDRPPILLLQALFLTRLPSLLLHSSSEAPLVNLIAWHAAACLTWDAALAHVLQADNHHCLAWNNFTMLVGNLGTTPCHDKGKHCKSPVLVHNNSDLGIVGFAGDDVGDDDSGKDEDKEDCKKDEDEDRDKDNDEDGNGDGAMDVS